MKLKSKNNLLSCFLLLVLFVQSTTGQYKDNENLEWWRDARFGMFIHWGLYSVAAGEWNGKEVYGIGEWIQNYAQIPNSEYEKLVDQFNPTAYNPELWIKMAKEAGVKYMVFTTKHHDGFCLFPSKHTDYDIESTDYKGDPLKELVDACHKYDVKVGFYYSHRQDWREEDAVVMDREYDGHFGKPKSELKPDLDRYIKNKAIPQMRELLTNYGKIDLLWYDTPFDMNYEQSKQFVDIIRELQPNCLVNGRVGHDLGDYMGLGDNEMPTARATKDLEMIATLNHTWGYKKNDHEWKDPKEIVSSLIECASRGINYMVNIGPKANGVVPQPSIDIFAYIQDWMATNGESIYGTSANPFADNFPWGFVTSKEKTLYLHLTQQPLNNTIELKGLKSKLKSAVILGQSTSLQVSNGKIKTITVPEGLDYATIPVVKLSLNKSANNVQENMAYENRISIPVSSGTIVAGKKGSLNFSNGRVTENFNEKTGKVILECTIDQPGTYEIELHSSRHWRRSFCKGTHITLKNQIKHFNKVELVQAKQFKNAREKSYPESASKIGQITFAKKGTKQFELSIDKIGSYDKLGPFGEDLQGMTDSNIRVMRLVLKKVN